MIAESATVARTNPGLGRIVRRDDEWFVGVLDANSPRTIALPLTSLVGEAPYVAMVHRHDERWPSATRVRRDELEVVSGQPPDLALDANDGVALHIAPRRR